MNVSRKTVFHPFLQFRSKSNCWERPICRPMLTAAIPMIVAVVAVVVERRPLEYSCY